jgi:hypothetical protein
MPPRTDHPRLGHLDPHAFAAAVCADHVAQLRASAESVLAAVTTPLSVTRSALYHALCDLCRYARGELARAEPVQAQLDRLAPLWRTTGLASTPRRPEELLPDTSPLGVVVLAALGRDVLERGEPVPARWLAALGGCSVQYIRYLYTHGTLVQVGRGPAATRITADSASAWLQTWLLRPATLKEAG